MCQRYRLLKINVRLNDGNKAGTTQSGVNYVVFRVNASDWVVK